GTSINYLPAWIAYKKGFFEKHGLDVSIIQVDGGTPTLQGLVAGQYPIAISSVFETMTSRLGGSDAVVAASFVPYMPHQLIVSPDIDNAEDLKGKALAMSKAGCVSDFVRRSAVQELGLEPEKDVTIIAAGR